MVSVRGKKRRAHAQVGLLLQFNSKFLMGILAAFNGSPLGLLHEYTLFETLLE